jgi:hypothetical protein
MMTKPPGFASSSTLPMEDDDEESIDESLDEILLEANERPQENSVKSLEAVPSRLDDADSDADSDPDLMGSGLSNGATAGTAAPPSDVTVIAPRPTFADDEVKEETKVDPYETAIRAAATRDDGLTSQASQQRDRALRKSTTPVRTPARAVPANANVDAEFEDANSGDDGDTGDDDATRDASGRTPADIPVFSGEADSSPAGGHVATNTGTGGYMPRLPPPGRPSPPPGRPDIYPGRRIPTPSSDFLPSPTGGFGSGAHYPSIAIPAPSAHDSSSRTSTALTDGRVRLPMAGLAMFLLTAFAGGLLVGALLWRGHALSAQADQPLVTHAIPQAPTELVQPIVKPVAPPSATAAPSVAAAPAVVPAPAPAAAAAPGAAAAAAAKDPAIPTLAAETPPAATDATTGDKPKRSKPKRTTTLDEDLAAAANEPPPPPRPNAKAKKKISWQDPFAQ